MPSSRTWWKGEDSVLNERATDFIFAMWGLAMAHRRLADGHPVLREPLYTYVECAWWIGAAAEACGRKSDGSILQGFYWVRNQGFHRTALAMGRVMPRGSFKVVLDEPGIDNPENPALWLPLPEDTEGHHVEAFNRHLGGRPIAETVEEAFQVLVTVADAMANESGLYGINEFKKLLL